MQLVRPETRSAIQTRVFFAPVHPSDPPKVQSHISRWFEKLKLINILITWIFGRILVHGQRDRLMRINMPMHLFMKGTYEVCILMSSSIRNLFGLILINTFVATASTYPMPHNHVRQQPANELLLERVPN